MDKYAPLTFPIDPYTGFVSDKRLGFRGCMLCGIEEHVFSNCPRREEAGARSEFFKHLLAHKPHLRKNAIRPEDMVPGFVPAKPFTTETDSTRQTQSFPAAITGKCKAAPQSPPLPPLAPDPVPKPVLSAPIDLKVKDEETEDDTTDRKTCRLFVQMVTTFSNPVEPHVVVPPMPIAIDNGLPHIIFELGGSSSTHTLQGLMDTCGALNTGYLLFHQWVMSENPSLVAEYMEFNAKNPFEPVKLGGAIRDPDGFNSDNHGNLTAVIRYWTPYFGTDGVRITISFALGMDVTVNTIFGLPMLTDLGSMISLPANVLHSTYLNKDFPIFRGATSFGLPAGCTFNPTTHEQVTLCKPNPTKHVHFSDDSSPALTTATDTHEKGYLQRIVGPT